MRPIKQKNSKKNQSTDNPFYIKLQKNTRKNSNFGKLPQQKIMENCTLGNSP